MGVIIMIDPVSWLISMLSYMGWTYQIRKQPYENEPTIKTRYESKLSEGIKKNLTFPSL